MNKRNFFGLVRDHDQAGSHLCVGFDPDMEKIPKRITGTQKDPVKAFKVFGRYIIEQTADHAAAYKPNLAFFEAIRGAEEALHYFIEYAHKYAPNVAIIGDSKNSDIGNTNKFYAKKMFERYGFDAMTGNPYMGGPTDLGALLQYPHKGFIPVLLTSNADGKKFQQLVLQSGTQFLFQKVAEEITIWNKTAKNLGVVIGATQNHLLIEKALRNTQGIFTLVPGIGVQGGDLETMIKLLVMYQRFFVINSTRGIIYAERPDKEAMKLSSDIYTLKRKYLQA